MQQADDVKQVDIHARRIFEGVSQLQSILEEPRAKQALDLTSDARTTLQYSILKRLVKSLSQYLERNGDLFYVGLVGHFSSGKSSTINSILGVWGSADARTVDLHPTDDTITLITAEKNENLLLGVIKEGHVTIRSKNIDRELLQNIVLTELQVVATRKSRKRSLEIFCLYAI